MNLIVSDTHSILSRSIIVSLLLTMAVIPSMGQVNMLNFQSLQEGLPNPDIKCILKDSKGFMWFGTSDGLARYDGTKFVIYQNNPFDTNSISHNEINVVIEDDFKNIWIGTAYGLNIYSREKDNFSLIKAFGERDVFFVTTLFYDSQGILWVGTAGNGLFSYDPDDSKVVSYTPSQIGGNYISSNFISCIIEDKEGNLWIGTRDGLDCFNKDREHFLHFKSDSPGSESLSNNNIKDLAMDKQGNLWIATYGGGLDKLEKKNGAFIFTHFRASEYPESVSHNSIFDLCNDGKGNLWIGTENGGLNVLHLESKSFSHYFHEDGIPGSLSSNSIWSIYYDNTGILWVGTSNKGLSIYDQKFEKFRLIQKNAFAENTLASDNVKAFAEDQLQNLWIATDGGGLCYFDTKTRQFKNRFDNQVLSSMALTTMVLDSRKDLWIGTWGGGIERIDSNNGRKIKNYMNDGAGPANNIMKIYEDKSGTIWAGTAGRGLYMYDRTSDDFLQVTDKENTSHLTKTAYVSSLLEDHNNTLWIGTMFGLICMKRNGRNQFSFYQFSSTPDPKSISSFRINVIFEDSRHNLWIGTDYGLNLFNPSDSTFTVYQKHNGLSGNIINGILEDKQHNLWISTNNGISKFNPSKNTFYNYAKEDGLCTNTFNLGSCIKTSSGEFFFGGNNGINTFYPDSIKVNTYIPPVYITDLQILNNPVKVGAEDSPPMSQSIAETKGITLTHEQNSFTLEFVALNYTRSAKNQYAYMLQGFEKKWNYVGARRFATYTNLNPGKYVFKVKGSNNDGVWNEKPRTLEIAILPPFWKTVWAYIVYFLIFFILLFSFIKLFMIKAQQAQKLRLEKMNHEKDEELNNLKIQFFTNVSHELRTPLSLIISPIEEIISRRETKGESINKLELALGNAEKVVGLVNELMDFTKSEGNRLKMVVQKGNLVRFTREVFCLYTGEADRKEINYQFVTALDQIDAWFDKNKIEKVIHNLISNAFKYTPQQGRITVKVDIYSGGSSGDEEHLNPEGYVIISVIDNGSGISPQYLGRVFDRFFQSPEEDALSHSGTGIGLALAKNLIELHHGKVSVTSQKWEKTCFKVMLPLGNSHFKDNEIILGQTDTSSSLLHNRYEPMLSIRKGVPAKDAPRVLIIEDNRELRGYLVSVLSEKFRILEAPEAETGIEIASTQLPDLILSDIIMPRMNGIEFCKKIKEDASTSHIPLILLTSKATVGDKIEGVEKGADAYITKPFNIHHLEITIHKLIETRKRLFKRFSQDVYIIPREMSNNKSDMEFLEKIVEYIDRNLMNAEITVENLASCLKMNRSNIYRKVKALTGQTATGFIRTVRLKMSLKYIESGEYNISEIAFMVGFESPSYFAKCFKKQFGKSPSEYLPVVHTAEQKS